MKHVDHFANAVTLGRIHDPGIAVNIFDGQQFGLKTEDGLLCGVYKRFFGRICWFGEAFLFAVVATVSVAISAESVLIVMPMGQSEPVALHTFPFRASILSFCGLFRR